MMTKRGALIVLEGCDKAGKSTHSKRLMEALKNLKMPAHLMCFPDRTTAIGKILDQYLRCQTEVQDQAIHLLFSANRWELVPKINSILMSGESIILDRYAYSGVAFSSAKNLNLNWCKSPDIGLPKPDIVFYLNLPQEEASQRGNFGEERYENMPFQTKVKNVFFRLKDDNYWKIVDSTQSIEAVHEELLKHSIEIIKQNENEPIKSLWENMKVE